MSACKGARISPPGQCCVGGSLLEAVCAPNPLHNAGLQCSSSRVGLGQCSMRVCWCLCVIPKMFTLALGHWLYKHTVCILGSLWLVGAGVVGCDAFFVVYSLCE